MFYFQGYRRDSTTEEDNFRVSLNADFYRYSFKNYKVRGITSNDDFYYKEKKKEINERNKFTDLLI